LDVFQNLSKVKGLPMPTKKTDILMYMLSAPCLMIRKNEKGGWQIKDHMNAA